MLCEDLRPPEEQGAPEYLASTLEERYARWSGPLRGYLRRVAGGNHLLAEDLFQETWMKALEQADQLRDPACFGAWLFRIARNLALHERRKGQRKTRICNFTCLAGEAGVNGDPLDSLAHPAPGPLSHTIAHERRQIVRRVLADLDPLTRLILHRRYYEWQSLSEIAAALDAPLGTVCTRIHRGLKASQGRLRGLGIHAYEEI